MDSLRAPLAFLRTLAVAGAMAAPALASPTAETPKDSVTLQQPTRTTVDADGAVIHRYGNPDRLGRLADQARLGTGPDDARVINREHGYVVMAGKDHPTDHLTVPTAPISGVESPELTGPDAENYFADAWKDGRRQTAESLGTTVDQLPREAIALAVNSQGGRSQDRLHIHADRLDPELGAQLKEQLESGGVISDQWTLLKPIHGDHQYRALWVEGSELSQNPFQLVHDQLVAEHGEEYARTHMGQHSLAVVGQTDANGRPGFVILDGRYGSDPSLPNGPHDSASAEEWLLGHANTRR
ncbi:MAG: CDP-diacylglycerol diphosphatase [Candidatus Eremiobacteraeota bacterium]|nr:CDP-diacylglycerol diphosphatase [Candidatus Eremiobacteraeota bacterium]MCW5868577.1 CDP-diacylglycerol diphosphatase [Candidatus Eremiobacteraeota bacterium]